MEAETIEKEEYRKMSGMQELQWSKGNDPVLTPPNFIETNLMIQERNALPLPQFEQLSIFDSLPPTKEDKIKCLTGSL